MASTFYTTPKVEAARRNIARYDWARTLQAQATSAADRYVAKGDDWLWSLVTGQRLPRSYAVNQLLGSPITGTEIFTFGNYPWQADPLSRPWKLADPSSEYVFPTNDFEAYYRSGLDAHALFDRERADRRLLVNTLYPQRGPTWGVDDGYGWIDDQGHKWTFIAYYNHWFTWYGTGAVHTAMRALRDAYVYSGGVRYARAGLILLDRIADVYPSMDTAPYKRADGFLHSDGGTGRGKIVGSIWETGLVRDFVSAYDAFSPAIATADVADVVPFLSAKARRFGLAPKESVEAIKQHVEDNLLRQVFSATKAARIRGNFGMHQSALAMAAVVLDHPSESREWIDWMFKSGRLETSPEYHLTGGNFLATLVDDVDRDGFGNEAAPEYNHLWITNVRRVADILAGYQRYPAADLYRHLKLKKLFASRHSLVMINRYQPSIGDSGSTGNPGLPG
ncbi:MAG TPA: hypothetical protein VHN78_12995, partial [Chloroflexota bacterium]|nr:hypothetical protein [Chloroflexota bacterium]